MRASIFGVMSLLVAACSPAVSREVIERPAQKSLRPEVLDRSAPAQPDWTDGSVRQAIGHVGFVGEASGPELETAKEAATRELYAAISSFVAVDVTADAKSVEWHASKGGAVEEGQSISSKVATRTASTLSNVAADALYWERVAASPLAPSAEYRVWVHAWVPKGEIVRARQKTALVRDASARKRTIAVLPLRDLGGTGVVAAGLGDELSTALARRPALHVGKPDLVRSAAGDPGLSESEAIERVEDALLPDWIVSGAVDRQGDRVQLALTLHDGRTGRVHGTMTRAVARSEIPTLAARGAGWLTRQVVDAKAEELPEPGKALPPNKALEAFEAYHEAYAAAARGDYTRALEHVRRAIALRPDHAGAYLRLGRILERMGRYGRITQRASAAAAALPPYGWCTEEGRRAEVKARAVIAARAARIATKASAGEAWWTPTTLDVDQALGELSSALTAAYPPTVAIGSELRAAAEAYLLAAWLARQQGDVRGFWEAALALVDLAVRSDRLAEAMYLAEQVRVGATSSNDLHFASLAAFSIGVNARKQGNPSAARRSLLESLALRGRLGEKPYLLEIYNELGGVAFDEGALAEAEAWYALALHLADQLGNDYLAAVLANNLGVVDLARGRMASAERRFHRAADFLENLGEAEGRVSAGIDLARITALRGDGEGAEHLLGEAGRVLEATTQEGRLAELEAHRGVVRLEAGKVDDALVSFATSGLLYQGLGRRPEAARVNGSLIAAELEVARRAPTAEVVKCLVGRSFAAGAAAFAPEGEAALDPSSLPYAPVGDLVLAANGAALSALSDWTPVSLGTVRWAPRSEGVSMRPPFDPRLPYGYPYGYPGDELQRPHEQRPPERRAEPGQAERPQLDPRAGRPSAEPEQRETVTTARPEADERRADKTRAERPVATKVQEYERILGAFTTDTDALVLLDPKTVEARGVRGRAIAALGTLGALEAELRRRGLIRAQAAVLLDCAALEWLTWSPEAAYRAAMDAADLFAHLGDARGLAYTHEWLGRFLEASGANTRAAEHLAMAHGLFVLIGDQAGAARLVDARP